MDVCPFHGLELLEVVVLEFGLKVLYFLDVICLAVDHLSLELFLILLESQYLIIGFSGDSLEFVDIVVEFVLSLVQLVPVLPNLVFRGGLSMVNLPLDGLEFHLMDILHLTDLVVLPQFELSRLVLQAFELLN